MTNYNPFSKRETHATGSLTTYKVLAVASWLLVHIANIHFAWNAPKGGYAYRTIWGQNQFYPTPFSLNPTIVDIYWVVILILQIGYIYYLFTGPHITAAANVASHFIVNNLLLFGFVLLWVRSFFWIGELLLVINFFNLSALYFRHPTTPLLIHLPVVSGPLAWNFIALLWCGAAMVNAHTLVARILANVAIWGILGYGLFFLVTYKDYTIGFNLSVLSAALGVHQFFIKLVAFQWIFAFVIMSVLFIVTALIAILGFLGKPVTFGRNTVVGEDQERAPLLNDGA